MASERDVLIEIMQDNIPMLKDIHNSQKREVFLNLVKRKISAKRYKAGKIILYEGDRLEYLHLIIRGCIRKYYPKESVRTELELGSEESEILSKKSLNRSKILETSIH